MNDEKKKEYPAQSGEDNRYKSQDEFDNAPREDRKVEKASNESTSTSTAPPDPVYKDISNNHNEV